MSPKTQFETSTFVLVCTCIFTQMYLSQIFTHSVIRGFSQFTSKLIDLEGCHQWLFCT